MIKIEDFRPSDYFELVPGRNAAGEMCFRLIWKEGVVIKCGDQKVDGILEFKKDDTKK